MGGDDADSERLLASAAEWVSTPAWAQESPAAYAQFLADRVLAMAYRLGEEDPTLSPF